MTRKILLVDDDDDVLMSMRDVLQFAIADADVQTAHSGKDALDQMRRRRPDALVTDYRMPGMDGLELAEAAKRARPRMPIIMVTAYNDLELEERAQTAGVRIVLRKPLDVDLLVEAVESGLRSKR